MTMQNEENRQFRGIWIDRKIWLDERISALDKVILAEIDSLDTTEDGCYASNEYLAKFCQCSTSKVSSSISKLIELGYLSVQKFDGRMRYLKSCLTKNESQPSKICKADSQNLEEINIDNNINNNNICPSENGQECFFPLETELSTTDKQIVDNFEEIWKNYPRKDGKNTAFRHYKAWLKGRDFAGKKQKLTNREMWFAVKIYAYECERDNVKKQYIKMGSTFFNETIAEKVKRYNDFPAEWEAKLKEWSEK